MRIRAKKQVQKSFRLDERIERDLGILAAMTERSQNDLVNIALSELLQDNKEYFLKIAIREHFENQIRIGVKRLEPFIMSRVKVDAKYIDDDKVEIQYSFKDKNGNYDEPTSKIYVNDSCREFKADLEGLGYFLEINDDDVHEYLKQRTDYSDYVKVKNN